jgi:hypothetical protein
LIDERVERQQAEDRARGGRGVGAVEPDQPL